MKFRLKGGSRDGVKQRSGNGAGDRRDGPPWRGTGARVVERLQTAGRLVRALVRSDDDRAERLRESGVQTAGGRPARPPDSAARAGWSRFGVCCVSGRGGRRVRAGECSVGHPRAGLLATRRDQFRTAHVDLNSPSGISREFAVGEELEALELGLNVTVLRINAFFYENVLLAHSGAIRETGRVRQLLRRCPARPGSAPQTPPPTCA